MIADKVEFSIGSKVFLAGEYLCLKAGPSLTVSIAPRFVLQAQPSEVNQNCPFAQKSPAGLLWESFQDLLTHQHIQFIDPHMGAGGFGGSTAEFALLYATLEYLRSGGLAPGLEIDFRKIWQLYRTLTAAAGPWHPSGADLIGQLSGVITSFDRELGRIQSRPWPFADLDFLVFRTPVKVATHEHLAGLSDFCEVGLRSAMQHIQQGLTEGQDLQFCQGINEYAQALENLGFLADSSKIILKALSRPEILAKKACGALGADVIILFYRPSSEAKSDLIDMLKALNCVFVGSQANLTQGLAGGSICQV